MLQVRQACAICNLGVINNSSIFKHNNYTLYKVSLGVNLNNESKTEEMVEVLDVLHTYVPTTTSAYTYEHPDTEEEETLNVHRFNHVLVGGDQLTVSRIRSAQQIRKNSNDLEERLEGLVPFIQDWHSKLCFMQVD